ncbi:MAG: AAA family ATPase, partial [Alicyclobacillus sp.]|nr:AAA family ATPase [Alicyclobacillus sp.]
MNALPGRMLWARASMRGRNIGLNKFPFVGMESERAELQTHVDTAAHGHGDLVLLGGEAGAGKTTIVQTVLSEHDVPWVTGYSVGRAATPPFGPWIEVVAKLKRIFGWDTRTLPLPFGQAPRLESMHELAGVLSDWLGQRGRPLVVIIEDLHMADATSLELLSRLTPRLQDWPLLVIGTYRTDELHRNHPLWHVIPEMLRFGASRVLLGRLTREDVAELLHITSPEWLPRISVKLDDQRGQANCYGTFLDDATDRVYKRTSGLPFFVREMIEMMIRTGQIPKAGDALPQTLQQAIDSRFARLPSCPGNHESAGKRKSGRTRKGNPTLRRALVEAAQAAGRPRSTYLSAQFKRLVHRRGSKRAAVAVGHTILVIAYHLLK